MSKPARRGETVSPHAALAERRLILEQRMDELLEEFRELEEAEREHDYGRERERGGDCKDQECKGRGSASHYVRQDKCPDPCDPKQYTDDAADRAKVKAKRAATVNCRLPGNPLDCVCKGGTFAETARGCETVTIDDVKYCEYTVEYEYTGRCANPGA